MDTASKLIDLLVDWGRRGKRWPLLLILLVPVYFVLVQKYFDIKFAQVLESRPFLWLSATTVLLSLFLYLLLNKYDRIAYSRAMDLLRRGPRVAITPSLAWPTITYDDGTGGTESVTVVRELARLLRLRNMHPVVVSHPQAGRYQFILGGAISGVGLILRSSIAMREAQILELAERLTRDPGSGKENPEAVSVTVPLARVLGIDFLATVYHCSLSVPAGQSNEQRTAIIRVFLRQALMTTLYRDRHPAAKGVAQAMVDLGEFLSPVENTQIATIFKGAALHFITTDEDFSEGARALRIAARFAPADHTIVALQAILALKMKRLQEALELIGRLDPATPDRALLCWLQADHFMATGQRENAIASFEKAIALEENPEHQATLHFNAAFAYAMAATLDSRHRADGMIRHLEDAIHIDDNPVLHVLKGYAWALRGNAALFEAEFAKIAAFMEGLPALKRYAENWKARGLRELDQADRIAESVLSIVGPPEESNDVANLLVLAGAALDLARNRADEEHLAAAERYVNRVLTLQPRSGEAYRYRASIHVLRADAAIDAAQKAVDGEKAREALLMSIRVGDEKPASQAMLGYLYEEAGDPVNAAKHRRRWLELSPADPSAMAYQALDILDRTGRLEDAEAHLAGLEGKSKDLGIVYGRIAAQALKEGLVEGQDLREGEPSARLVEAAARCLLKAWKLGNSRVTDTLVTILMELAEMHRDAGRLDATAERYAACLEVDPANVTAHNNLAFLLFDRDEFTEALRHWDQALQVSPDDADAIAGKAAALRALGRNEEALACYKQAVSLNGDFLDEAVMRDKYLWSDKALRAVRPLMKVER